MEPGYEIYEYARRGLLENLRDSLREGVGPDLYMAYDGSTAIVMAARHGNGAVVKELLAHKANHEVCTDEGSTLLHHAVSGNSAEVIRHVLQAGVSVNVANEDGVSALMLAAHYGNLDVVRAICEAGADLAIEADGWGTALDSAEKAEVIEFLESRGAKRSANGVDQPVAAAAERFNYGCFESGELPSCSAKNGYAAAASKAQERKAKAGDCVQLRKPKSGLLQEGDVGTVVVDDGSDCLPLKVSFNDRYDYYNHEDIVVCEAPVDLGPDSDRATVEGTTRYLQKRLHASVTPSTLGSAGLCISPVGFGCHRIENDSRHKGALELALTLGCNFIDLAPNYVDGVSEEVVGTVLSELLSKKKIRRDEIVVASKVGNVLGRQMKFAEGVPKMATINDTLSHCISPEWIEQELTRSLERLGLSCLDCLLLHCPEAELKDPSVDQDEVYRRLKDAFAYLETEVAKGRIQMYGVSAAFHPLRPTDPEHLDLETVMAQLPEKHHFQVLQFPMNFAEAQIMWVGHTRRHPDGTAVVKEQALSAPTFFEAAKKHNLTTFTNRPLDGIYKEEHGVLRFSSLDCDVRSFSQLQLDNCDQLEEKLTRLTQLDEPPYAAVEGTLASKTVKVISSLKGVDCVLCGMRQPEYVLGTLMLALGTPPLPDQTALTAFKSLHGTVEMWFATAIHEADHGTAKDWRLPINQKYQANDNVVGA